MSSSLRSDYEVRLLAGRKGTGTLLQMFHLRCGVNGGKRREAQDYVPLAVAAQDYCGRAVRGAGDVLNPGRLGHVLHLADDLAAPATDAVHSLPPYAIRREFFHKWLITKGMHE